MKKGKKQSVPDAEKKSIVNMKEPDGIITDPQGSYTGVPTDPYDKPVQDADDL